MTYNWFVDYSLIISRYPTPNFPHSLLFDYFNLENLGGGLSSKIFLLFWKSSIQVLD